MMNGLPCLKSHSVEDRAHYSQALLNVAAALSPQHSPFRHSSYDLSTALVSTAVLSVLIAIDKAMLLRSLLITRPGSSGLE